MVDFANTLFRDFVTDGVPASGANKPAKSKIREWGTWLEGVFSGGPVSTTADSIAALKAVDSATFKKVSLIAGGRSGDFVWTLGNFSAQVAADTLNGIYVKADAVAATVGAWVRIYDGEVLPEWFGAVGDAATNDSAAIAAALAMGLPILLTKLFAVASAITLTNKAVSIRGIGQGKSGLLDTGVAINTYVLSITNDDYTYPVAFHDFSLLTSQATVSYGIYVKFGVVDGEFNRSPSRFNAKNVEVRGSTFDGVGRQTTGFKKGITLVNIMRPVCENVIIWGQGGDAFALTAQATNTVMTTGWDLQSDYDAVDPFKRASPTDPVFRDCHVYSADMAWKVRGHYEGLIFDHCVAVLVNFGFNLAGDTPTGVGGTQFPWVCFNNCHANVFYDGFVIQDYFDVVLNSPQIHKWGYAPAGFVSTAVKFINCPRVSCNDATVFNLTTSLTPEEFDGFYVHNCLGGVIHKPLFSGVTKCVNIDGTSADIKYTRGLVRDVPAFAPTPVEFTDTSSGGGNINLSLDVQAVANWLADPTSAKLRAALTDEVGTGAAYFVGGALGTPASATLTNATGLPVSTGVSGLGTGIATFLATPSSANLRSAITDEAGNGALLFEEVGTFTPLIIGSTSAGAGTYGGQFGRYAKFGTTYQYWATVVWSAHTGTGNLRLGTLPAACGNYVAAASVCYSNLTYTSQVTAEVVNATTYLEFFQAASNAARANIAIEVAAQLDVSGSYSTL
ncbi:hypothetical protein NKI20_02190 [Mesorhizobium sp. M0830]|uniref:hypothetical protein n=1 Tax=Mesorhizobium sp. M0830 TaxID=2957008 RepID=UPI00333CC180